MDASEAARPPATPLWVKALGLATLLAVVGFVLLHLTGNAPTGH